MSDPLDKETQEIITEGEHLLNLVRSDGWLIARRKLLERMYDVDSIYSIEDLSDGKTLAIEVAARKIAQDIITGWFNDIDGLAQQRKVELGKQLAREDTEEYVKRFE